MDALQQQQSHRFATTPPPPPSSSMSDPQQHQPHRQPALPPPHQQTWYPPNQFQFQASPAPPPPHPNNHSIWPNNHSDHQQQPISSSYPTPHQHAHPPPYPTHPPPQAQNNYYPPPHQHPPPYSQSQPPQGYPQHNTYQTWGDPNWAHHQVWEHSDRNDPNNNEDWASKARAWAASKSSMDSHHQLSQFTHSGRPEEPNHNFHDQYSRTADPHYANIQQSSLLADPHYANIQQSSLPATNHQQLSVPTESPSLNSVSSSYYASGLRVPYTSRGGGLGTDPNLVYPDQGNISTNSTVYQQEVPSSYTSVPGKGEVGGRDVQLHTTSSLPISSGQETQRHVLPTHPAHGRSRSEEQSYFAYGVGAVGSVSDPSDRPLEFAPGFIRNHESHDQHPQSSYVHLDPAGSVGFGDHAAAVPSMSALTHPVVSGMGYPPSGIQFDPSFAPPASMFGQITGPNFRSNVPTGGAAFGLGAGSALHPTASFAGEPNGIPNVSERPKKGPVPNWLREEIIKKKPVITSSSVQRHEEDPDSSNEDDNIEKSFVNGGPENGKTIDSSRSSDNEDNDEDAIEAARTAAINQEIKRVVTEVLLKVTDELFDEIATKVLKEDAPAIEVENNNFPANQKLSPSPPYVPALKASAKVLVPVKTEEAKSDYASGSPSVAAGDVLGLVSYASDDDDYDETESSSKSTKIRMAAAAPPASTKLSEAVHVVVENGDSQAENKVPSGTNRDTDHDKIGLAEAFSNPTATDKGLRVNELDKNLNREKDNISIFNKGDTITQEGIIIADGGNMVEATDDLKSKDTVGGKNSKRADLSRGIVGSKSPTGVSQTSQARSKADKNQEQENRRSYSSKDFAKDGGSGSLKVDSKHSGSGEPRKDERYPRKGKTDDRNGTRERVKDRGNKSGDNARESDSRRSSHSKDEKTENEKVKRDGAKDDSGRKRAREKDEREESLRHHGGRDSSSHKRRHSPSVDGRVRNSKDGHATESSDEASDDSRRRKKHSRRRSLSPSPTRSRRRQVSRSPHSKHSHRRQSPYSSLDTRRGRRSRSNTPVRRRR